MTKIDTMRDETVFLLIDKFDTMKWELVADLSKTIIYKTHLNDFTVYISKLDLYCELSYKISIYKSIYKRYRIDSKEIFNSGIMKDDNLKVLFNKCHSKYY